MTPIINEKFGIRQENYSWKNFLEYKICIDRRILHMLHFLRLECRVGLISSCERDMQIDRRVRYDQI